MVHPRFLASCLLACALASCGPRPKAPILQLPSGKEIRIVQIGTMHFSADKPAWMLKYETKTSFDNVVELRQEALELWEQYKGAVERAGRDSAILSANEPTPHTVISHTRGYNFIVKKQPDGTWQMIQ
jgi:hypothetical protein